MKRKRQPVRTPQALWMDHWETGFATLATLAFRVPRLVRGTLTPAETQRMIAEKLEAARDGMIEGSIAAGKLALHKPRPQTFGRTLADALTLWDASTAPARRTVRANAKRLSSGAAQTDKRR